MSLLAKHSRIKEDKSNIITLGIVAGEAKKKNPLVINATIGMIYDDEGKLFSFDSVNKVIETLKNSEKFAYSSTPGSKAFHDALRHWVFQDYEEEILKDMYCEVIATPGGSGAISNTFSNYLSQNEKVLLPNYMWGNYKQITYENYLGYETYSLFNDQGKFNLEDLRLKMLQMKKEQQRVVLVINDPCHNPTGYLLSYLEWISLVSDINMISRDGTPVILLYDMAYIDYDKRGIQATRDNIRLFKSFNENVMVIFAFSGSKTLGLYGLRVGAQLCLTKSKENSIEFAKANGFSARAKWSNSSTLGMNIVTKILSNATYEESFKKELEIIRNVLTSRATAFIEEAEKVHLKTLPFDCGFFISIPCETPMEVYEKLVKEDIHVIPLDNVIRVTLAAITEEECRIIPAALKRAL